MLLFGTQMHIVTFVFICMETIILFYLAIHSLARPQERNNHLDIVLLFLLIVYNITGGLLPDDKLPGSYFIQESIAYGTGFITPCYFPYYVYRGFRLSKMHFHAYKGVWLCLALPYFLFVLSFYLTSDIDKAKNVLIVPVLYALVVIYAVWKAIRFKYITRSNKSKSKEEICILFLSLTPWVSLPVIAYFNLSQPIEAITTNSGFLLLLALHIQQTIRLQKEEYNELIESQHALKVWDEKMEKEIEKRTKELKRQSTEERITHNCKTFSLTNRETEIAHLLCDSLTYRLIGERLFIAERTVAKHIQNIFEKTGSNSRIELCKKLEDYPAFSKHLSRSNHN